MTHHTIPDWEEEFKEKFDQYAFEFPRIRQEVIDFWLSKFASHHAHLKERIKGKKKEETHADGAKLAPMTHAMVKGYNKGIDDVLKLLE